MSTILTHIRPHLDDVCGIWLLKRYHSEAKDAEVSFISTNEVVDESAEGKIYVGVGRGRFDEHKGDVGQCAASLVLDFLKEEGGINPRELKALERIVAWVLLEDTGRLNHLEHREFSVPVALKAQYEIDGKDSADVVELGIQILEALFSAQLSLVDLEDDWKTRVEFDSPYGRAVALVTAAREVDSYAYQRGFDLVVYTNPDRTYHNIKARADSEIDLTPLRDKLKEQDPESGWFFHHSKKMLICGGVLAPDVKRSQMSIEDLIEITK